MKKFIKLLFVLLLTMSLLISQVSAIEYGFNESYQNNDETIKENEEEPSDPDEDDSSESDETETTTDNNDDKNNEPSDDDIKDEEKTTTDNKDVNNDDNKNSEDNETTQDKEETSTPNENETNEGNTDGEDEEIENSDEDSLNDDNSSKSSEDDNVPKEDDSDNADENKDDENLESDNIDNEKNNSPNIDTKPEINYLINRLNTKNMWSNKTVYLTFDDGPSWVTEKILDILKKYNIKATFFVVGNSSEYGKSLLRRMVKEGHSIGNHTYSHNYSYLYKYSENFFIDLYKNEKNIFNATGIKPNLVRFPGGSNNQVHKKYTKEDNVLQKIANKLESMGYKYFDWNASSGDASKIPATVDQIIENILRGISKNSNAVVLMHDTSSKVNTLKALPTIIEKLKFLGCELKPLSKDSPNVKFLKIRGSYGASNGISNATPKYILRKYEEIFRREPNYIF